MRRSNQNLLFPVTIFVTFLAFAACCVSSRCLAGSKRPDPIAKLLKLADAAPPSEEHPTKTSEADTPSSPSPAPSASNESSDDDDASDVAEEVSTPPAPNLPSPLDKESDAAFQMAKQFDSYLKGKLDFEESQGLQTSCRMNPLDNPFCYSVLNFEALEEKLKKPRVQVKAQPPVVKIKFRRGRLQNWTEIRGVGVQPLLKTVSATSPRELVILKKRALSEKQCPNNLAIAVAATLEDQLPEKMAYREIASLYEKGGNCTRDIPADRENLLTRAGLFYFAADQFKKAAKVFALSVKVPTTFTGRPLYWLYRTQQKLKLRKKSLATLLELQTKYPFSFHTLVALTASNRDPGEVLNRSQPQHLTRSKNAPLLNHLLLQVEILQHFDLEESAKHVLDWAVAESTGAEPELLIYLSELKKEQGDYHGKISILSDVLYRNPLLVSRETLELYFPKVYFPIFEKQSSRIDPYLLLAIARRESAFHAGSHVCSRGKRTGAASGHAANRSAASPNKRTVQSRSECGDRRQVYH